MQTLFLALLLAGVFVFFSATFQVRLRSLLHARPGAVWVAPLLLTAVFASAAALAGAWNPRLIALVLAYTAAPVACVFALGSGYPKRPHFLDFAAILWLWLPLEFAAGASLVARPAQGFLHSVAYGVAILLGLVLFIGFRSFEGLRYNLPRARRDYWLPLAGYAVLAPVLMVAGIALGFLPAPHLPTQTAGRMAAAVGIVFVGTALPEEILFRSLIQNLLMQRFGEGARTLAAASLIFGCAHLDNGPQPLPNWRYMILATLAGLVYGRVFQKSSTVFSSAALHMLVDWTKHFFF
jgi:membrane protease YdiL (CAAX protease family)